MAFPSLRKHLSAPGLLRIVRQCFDKIPDHRAKKPEIGLTDALMSGLAVFQFKYPSLLKFDEERNETSVRHNLRTLFGVPKAPCDTQLRDICDPVEPKLLRAPFRSIFTELQKGKVLEEYRYPGGYYLVSIDGTGQFASSKISCKDCCVKKNPKGEESYYHQLLGAVIVHPDKRTVLPLAPEPILKKDGDNKNDCERSASKRLITRLREEFPRLRFVIVEDALSGNGPHLNLLKEQEMSFIIGVKEGDHKALFDAVQQALAENRTEEFEKYDSEIKRYRGYRFVNDIPLNKTYPDLLVNFLEYWEVDEAGNQTAYFTWITDIRLSENTAHEVMRGGRARWKVENETFNTLKNQGYRLEHNYGHGKQHLATVFAYLMMLAFLIDQVQELSCGLFKKARQRFRSRTSLWNRMRVLVVGFLLDDWVELWKAIILGIAPSRPVFDDTS
jgi:hypothetical protein